MSFVRGKKAEPDKSILFERPQVSRPQKSFSGKSPNILIGSFGYPQVNVGSLHAQEYVEGMDDVKSFIKQRVPIDEILVSRQILVNSLVKAEVKDLKSRFVSETQEIAMSSKAVDTEVELDRPLLRRMEFHERSLPHGPSASLKSLKVVENVKVKPIVEKMVGDTDVKSLTAMNEMYKKNVDEYELTKLLSAGTLGIDRKMVPTKWAITAVDDSLGKRLRNEVLDYAFSDLKVFVGEYIGNFYVVVVFPGDFSFELIEYSQKGHFYNQEDRAIISKDYELVTGRKEYAYETAGGYYASRLAVLKYLSLVKRQGRVIVYRIITKDYSVPLGVWTVRETVSAVLSNKGVDFSSGDEALAFVKEKLGEIDKDFLDKKVCEEFIAQSVLLREEQTTMKRWKKEK
jgi:DNA repair protein NreA